MQLLEYTAFHLVCSLVGKSDRQDMSVSITVSIPEQQAYICSGEAVGLT